MAPISLTFTDTSAIYFENLGGPLFGIKKLIGMKSEEENCPFCIEPVTLTKILGLVTWNREVI
jgi:hypothetical protein